MPRRKPLPKTLGARPPPEGYLLTQISAHRKNRGRSPDDYKFRAAGQSHRLTSGGEAELPSHHWVAVAVGNSVLLNNSPPHF